MPRGTFYESEARAFTSFSFAVEIEDAVWVTITDATLPQSIPAVVVQAPGSGAAKILYDVLAVGSANLGPVRIVTEDEPTKPGAMSPLALGDTITIQVLGRLPD